MVFGIADHLRDWYGRSSVSKVQIYAVSICLDLISPSMVVTIFVYCCNARLLVVNLAGIIILMFSKVLSTVNQFMHCNLDNSELEPVPRLIAEFKLFVRCFWTSPYFQLREFFLCVVPTPNKDTAGWFRFFHPYNAKTPLLEVIPQASGVIFVFVKVVPNLRWNKFSTKWSLLKV